MITNNIQSMGLFKGPLNKCQGCLLGGRNQKKTFFSHRCEWSIAIRAISCWQLLQRRTSLQGGSTFKKSIGSEKAAVEYKSCPVTFVEKTTGAADVKSEGTGSGERCTGIDCAAITNKSVLHGT